MHPITFYGLRSTHDVEEAARSIQESIAKGELDAESSYVTRWDPTRSAPRWSPVRASTHSHFEDSAPAIVREYDLPLAGGAPDLNDCRTTPADIGLYVASNK
jgi:hypothetical protein